MASNPSHSILTATRIHFASLRLVTWNAGAKTQSQVCPFEAVDWNIRSSHILHKGIDNAFKSCRALNLQN
jgi:hypothetical protein